MGPFGAKSTKTDFRVQVLEDPAAARGDRGPGNPEAADEDDQLRRNATALPPHVTMSHTPLHRRSAAGK
jgi:hypothetical protein